MKEEYEPFGEEWEQEMMKWKKEDLVAHLRKTILSNREVVERLQIANVSEYQKGIRECIKDIQIMSLKAKSNKTKNILALAEFKLQSKLKESE